MAAPKPAPNLFGGANPVGYVNALYAPQTALLQQQQAARTAGLQNLVQAILGHLQTPEQASAATNAAVQDTNAAAQAAANHLVQANPNDQTMAMLRSIGAPTAQMNQVTGQNQNAFGGQAGVLQYLGGVVPSTLFGQDQQARSTYLSALPSIVGSQAIMGQNALANLASKENLALAQAKATAVQKAQSDLASYRQAQQRLGLEAQNQAFNQAAKKISLNQGQQRINQSAARLNLDAKKFARSMLQQDRSYSLQLQRLGISKKNLQLRALAQEYKAQNGGFSAYELNRFNTDASLISQNARAGFTDAKGVKHPPLSYQDAMKEMLSSNIPPSIAQKYLNQQYPITQRPVTPFTIQQYQQVTADTPPQQYAIGKLGRYGWNGPTEAAALNQLWTRESGWNPNAINKSSGAAGIPQALGHKLPPNYANDYRVQIDWGLNYIKQRYGSPSAAWAHELKFGWY